MLVPFAIDVGTLVPDPGWSPAQQKAYHQSLLRVWQQIGVLVHDGQAYSASQTKLAIDSLPAKLLPLWQELIERLPLLPGPMGWTGCVENSNVCLDCLCGNVRAALVDDTTAEAAFSIGEGDLYSYPTTHPNLEICRFIAADSSRVFTESLALSGTHIEAGQNFKQLWAERFAILAKAPIKIVQIVDRYAVSQHFETPQGKLSGLERFLRLLDTDATGDRHVMLYSAWSSELHEKHVSFDDIKNELKVVLTRLPNHRIKRIKVHMLPNGVFGAVHHDRFIRFGEYVWDIGLGVKIFEGAFVPQRSAAAFKAVLQTASYKNVELELGQHQEGSFAVISH